jgi:protein-tyrosine phosphatase
MHNGRRGIAAALLIACAACGAPEPGVEGGTHQRHVPLDGQANFRDIGGYETESGQVIRWGQVYRSGRLPKLSDEDVARLEGLGIRTVVNFLTPEEVEVEGRDRLPTTAREISLPITSGAAGDLTAVVNEARRTGDFSLIPEDLNPGIHRILVEEARAEYAALFRELMDPANRPLVFHCSHGIHRTGTAAALLLALLGVPWETIRADYLLSNDYRREEVGPRLEHLRRLAAENLGVAPEQVDMTNAEAFYILEGSYIDATLEEVLEQYGTFENYFRDGLGLSDAEIERLRAELLQG